MSSNQVTQEINYQKSLVDVWCEPGTFATVECNIPLGLLDNSIACDNFTVHLFVQCIGLLRKSGLQVESPDLCTASSACTGGHIDHRGIFSVQAGSCWLCLVVGPSFFHYFFLKEGVVVVKGKGNKEQEEKRPVKKCKPAGCGQLC